MISLDIRRPFDSYHPDIVRVVKRFVIRLRSKVVRAVNSRWGILRMLSTSTSNPGWRVSVAISDRPSVRAVFFYGCACAPMPA
jgi:hypothetical protein